MFDDGNDDNDDDDDDDDGDGGNNSLRTGRPPGLSEYEGQEYYLPDFTSGRE